MALIFFAIAVEQINRDTPDVGTPNLERHPLHPQFDVANQRFARFAEHRLERQVFRVQQRVVFGLPAIHVDRLLEVAFAVEQTDAHKPNARIAGRLGVIARQKPQPTGGNGERLMKTKFCREIRHRIRLQWGRMQISPRRSLA